MRELEPFSKECVSYPLSHEPPRQMKKWLKRQIAAIDTRIVAITFGRPRGCDDYVVHLHVVSGVQHTRKFQRKLESLLRAAHLTKGGSDDALEAS